MGISEFDVAEITFLANDPIELTDPEEKRKFDELCDMLDELQDVKMFIITSKLNGLLQKI